MSKDLVNGKNTVVLLLILVHLFTIVYWNFYFNLSWDKNEDKAIFNTVRYYVQPTGLWQNWNVFAPPPKVENHVRIEGKAFGFIANYTPSYQSKPQRFHHEYERKWHENIVQDEHSNFRQAYLEYWCKRFKADYDRDFTEVKLFQTHREIPDIYGKNRPDEKFVKEWSIEC